MIRNSESPTIVWTVRVTADDVETFDAHFGIGGAKTWLIDHGLELFLEVVDKLPPAQIKLLHDDIQRHLNNERTPFPFITFSVRIRRELHDRFNAHFPERGGSSWFIRRMVRDFNRRMAGMILDDYLQQSVSSVAFPPRAATVAAF